jgi:hypothetical protein
MRDGVAPPGLRLSLRALLIVWTGALLCRVPQVAAQAPERWTLVRDLRIGSENRPNYSLSYVGDAAIGANGAIYVAQPLEKLVRQYDARGTYVRSFGRAGAGPGEFRELERIGWKGDTLWAADPVQRRANLFNGQGRPLGSAGRPGPVVPGSGYPTSVSALLSDGSVLGSPVPSTSAVQQGSAGMLPLLRMDRRGTVRGGFGNVDARGQFESIRRARMYMNLSLPLPYNSLWDVAPDGSTVAVVHRPPAASGQRASFRVASYRASGQVIFDRAYNYTPRALPPESRDSIHEVLATLFVRAGFVQAPGQARTFARDSVALPRFQPTVADLAVGRDGTIWLGRELLGVQTREYTVLAPDGRILAFVAAPLGVRILQADRTTAWGVETDEDEVPYVVRFRVAPAR